jgi:uncharacterized protein (DUF427 family)
VSDLRCAWGDRPDYRVDLLARTNVMTARLLSADPAGTPLARSDKCLVVDEQDHGLVVYFPPDAVDFTALEPVPGLHTVCPFKGQAAYWKAPASAADWVAWSYPEPFAQVARIAGYVAFDQDVVNVSIGKGIYTGVRP